MKESKFQADLIKELQTRFEGCTVLKNDERYIQGFPDLTILFRDAWAVLEVKVPDKNNKITFQPNQEYYIEKHNEMSFAKVVTPDNVKEVIDDLCKSFGVER